MHPFQRLLLNNGAQILFTPCPGTQQVAIEASLTQLKAAGAQTLVTLLTETDLTHLRVSSLPDYAKKLDLCWWHLPIKDDEVPQAAFEQAWASAKPHLLKEMSEAKTIAIHCQGGTGRTGMVAAMLLLEQGYDWLSVLKLVKTTKPNALTIPKQIQFLKQRYHVE